MAHTCHAHGCERVVPPRMMCCKPHWFKIRPELREAVWREYREGQERDKQPSWRYLAVQQLAIGELAFKPNDEEAARAAAPYLMRAWEFRQKAICLGQGDPLEGLVND